MIRWLSIGVISYMILGIVWWGLLISKKNSELYELKLKGITTPNEIKKIESERYRQTVMILGEGLVLGCSLLLGIYIINRSANKEIQNARQQSDFLLSVSHELKSPIAAIKLAIQTLLRNGLDSNSKKTIQESALKDSNRLQKLVQNILLSAKLDGNPLELYKTEFLLIDIIKSICDNYNSSNINRSFIIESHPKVIKIWADQQNINQAIGNIIDNALKYSTQESDVHIRLEEKNEEIFCHIENTGPTINNIDKTKIFEKFYRGSHHEIRKKEGAGIGLYISNEIIKAHGGKITVRSEENRNTFTLSIPKYG